MRELSVNNYRLKLYDSIDELPIVNFQKYNKYLLIDSGVGSDVDAVDEHLVNLAKLINTDKAKATQELQNLRQNFYFIVSNISPKYLAFAALIHSINGEKVEDLSDSNLESILEKLQAIKHSAIMDFLMRFKKKINSELGTYFPNTFGISPREKEVYDRLKQRAIFQLEEIIDEKSNSEDIKRIDDFLFSLYTPKAFSGSKSVEVLHDKNFEKACMAISQETHQNAKAMTTLEFYTILEELKKQADAKLKAYKSNKPKK